MAKATTILGGKVRVLLGNTANPIVYTAPCGFTSRSVTVSKALEEVMVPDCDNPDKIDAVARDAVSTSMAVSGEGVLATESIDVWLAASESITSTPAKVEIELPTRIITYTGRLHVESVELGAQNGRRATLNVSMQSDGEMIRTSVAK